MTNSQSEVLGVLKAYGPLPDTALVPLAQHVVQISQSSSSIRSRRAELVRLGLVKESGTIKTRSGRKAKVFAVNG